MAKIIDLPPGESLQDGVVIERRICVEGDEEDGEVVCHGGSVLVDNVVVLPVVVVDGKAPAWIHSTQAGLTKQENARPDYPPGLLGGSRRII